MFNKDAIADEVLQGWFDDTDEITVTKAELHKKICVAATREFARHVEECKE